MLPSIMLAHRFTAYHWAIYQLVVPDLSGHKVIRIYVDFSTRIISSSWLSSSVFAPFPFGSAQVWIFRRFVWVFWQGIRPCCCFCLRRKTRYSGSWVPNTVWHTTVPAKSAVEGSKALTRFLCIFIVVIIIILFSFLLLAQSQCKFPPIPMAGRSGAWVCGRSLAGITGSNSADGMVVCSECCVLSGRGLCDGLITRPEGPNRMCCVWVWSWILDNGKAVGN